MKYFIACGLMLVLSVNGKAQKQGNIWYFAKNAGLNFNSGVPIQVTGGRTGDGFTQEGTATIADSAGNLLFYSDGTTLFNRNHQPMANGAGLQGNTSSTQSCIIVPKPGSDSLFYVFASDAQENYPGRSVGYTYSVVDMCLDNGLGGVINGQKNLPLADSGTEKLCAGDDGQGGYWVMGHKLFTDEFHAWHLTTAGIADTVVSHTGMVHGSTGLVNASIGQMKFNPSCTKLAMVIQSSPEAAMEVFDFDPVTGVVSNPCHKVIDTSGALVGCYGLEFSPDGSRLYTTMSWAAKNFRAIYQFTVTSGNCNAIIASIDTVFVSRVPSSWFFGLQLGPDGKIYVATTGQGDIIGRINNPNLTGFAVAYDSSVFTLSGFSTIPLRMFPSFIAGYKYHNGLSGPCSVIIPNGITGPGKDEPASLYPNPVKGTAILNISPQIDTRAMQLVIKDAVGRMVRTIPVSTHKLSLDLSELVPGVYFYQLFQGNQIVKTDRFLAR